MRNLFSVLLALILAFTFLMSPAFAAEPTRDLIQLDMSTCIPADMAGAIISGLLMAEADSLMGPGSKRVGNLKPILFYLIAIDDITVIEDNSVSGAPTPRYLIVSGGMGVKDVLSALIKPEYKDNAARDLINVSGTGEEVALAHGFG